jgi:acetate kinase
MIVKNVLALNCGSTSIKYRLFGADKKELTTGQIEQVTDFDKGLKELLRQIITHGEITHVLHRIVHGGHNFYDPIQLSEPAIEELEKNNHLAPSHNPYNLLGIRAAIGFMPEARQIAVFDTGFYKNLPYESAHYALSPELTEKMGIRRFGFHGLSHEYVSRVAKTELKLERQPNLITAHLGGGASVTAISSGRPIDTSMGYTPNEGLIMMGRTGDIDSNLVLDLLTGLPGELSLAKIEQVRHLLNSESGIKALAGYDDFRDLLRDANLGKQPAAQAFNMFIHRLIKYIGAYHTLLGGKVDALVLTGSIGSGNPITKEALAIKLNHLKLPIITVKTNEELMMYHKAHEFGLI